MNFRTQKQQSEQLHSAFISSNSRKRTTRHLECVNISGCNPRIVGPAAMPNARVGAMPQPPQQHETYNFQQDGGVRGRRQQGITMQASPLISIHFTVIVPIETYLTVRHVLCKLTCFRNGREASNFHSRNFVYPIPRVTCTFYVFRDCSVVALVLQYCCMLWKTNQISNISTYQQAQLIAFLSCDD